MPLQKDSAFCALRHVINKISAELLKNHASNCLTRWFCYFCATLLIMLFKKSFFLFAISVLAAFVLASSKLAPASEESTQQFASNTESGSNNMVMYNLSKHIKMPALEYAFEGYEAFEGSVKSDRMIIIDFTLPSTEERFFVINPQTGEILFKKLVAHGQGTGDLFAQKFSNKNGSHQSSLGFFKTAETYAGKHGLSLRLDGLERGLNSAARDRAIVIHAADYVSEAFIAQNGYLGRSWGCPALPAEDYEEIINEIAAGTLLLIYHSNLSSLKGSL